MKKNALIGGSGTIEDSAKALSRSLFRGELLDTQIRSLPPQNLYLALKYSGLESSLDVLSIISSKQYRALLDFELWTKDSFREERLWAWLGIVEDPTDLSQFQKCINSLDPELISLLIRRYVEVVYHEERDDRPPGPNFYSPDQGSTWIAFKTHDPERHRLLGKLLAFLFETNTDLFYQSLLYAHESTSIELEESGYRDKTNRLLSEYIPTQEEAEDINKPGSLHEIEKELEKISKEKKSNIIENNSHPIIPFFSRSISYQPLLSMLEQYPDEILFEIQSELSRILNSAVVFYIGDFAEVDNLNLITEQVFGAINIGMQIIQEESPDYFSSELISKISITEIYKLGLSEIFALRKKAIKIPTDIRQTLTHMNEPLAVLLDYLSNSFPSMPEFLREDGTFELEDERLSVSTKAFSSIEEIKSIIILIEEQIEKKFLEIRSYEKQSGKHEAVKQNLPKDLQ